MALFNINRVAGHSINATFTFTDSAGAPVNVAGTTFDCKVKDESDKHADADCPF